MRYLNLVGMLYSITVLLAVLFGSEALEAWAVGISTALAVASVLTLAHPAGRAAVSKIPQSIGDLVLSLAVIYVFVQTGHAVAASVYSVAVLAELQARQFRFVSL